MMAFPKVIFIAPIDSKGIYCTYICQGAMTRCGKLIGLANRGSTTASIGWEMLQSRDIRTCYTPMHSSLGPLPSFNMYEETQCSQEFLQSMKEVLNMANPISRSNNLIDSLTLLFLNVFSVSQCDLVVSMGLFHIYPGIPGNELHAPIQYCLNK